MFAHSAGGEKVHGKGAITPPCPLRAQRFDSMKHKPRVVIPPPYRNAEKALCAGGNIVSVGAEHPL